MILSFPIDAWLLLAVAVGLGLALEIAFYRARRAERVGASGAGTPERSTRDGGDASGGDGGASRAHGTGRRLDGEG